MKKSTELTPERLAKANINTRVMFRVEPIPCKTKDCPNFRQNGSSRCSSCAKK